MAISEPKPGMAFGCWSRVNFSGLKLFSDFLLTLALVLVPYLNKSRLALGSNRFCFLYNNASATETNRLKNRAVGKQARYLCHGFSYSSDTPVNSCRAFEGYSHAKYLGRSLTNPPCRTSRICPRTFPPKLWLARKNFQTIFCFKSGCLEGCDSGLSKLSSFE